MTPQTQCCHNPHFPARGQRGRGNIHVHSRAEQRYRCSQCGRTFLAGRRVRMAMAMAVPARLWLGVSSARTATWS
jgi:transposase-like protein